MARLGSIARALAAAVSCAGVFVVALVAGAILHLDLPAFRRAVNDRLNRVFATALPGRITISAIGRIGTGRVEGVDAVVQEPNGAEVLRVKGLRAVISTARLLESLTGSGDLRIDLKEVAADDV